MTTHHSPAKIMLSFIAIFGLFEEKEIGEVNWLIFCNSDSVPYYILSTSFFFNCDNLFALSPFWLGLEVMIDLIFSFESKM